MRFEYQEETDHCPNSIKREEVQLPQPTHGSKTTNLELGISCVTATPVRKQLGVSCVTATPVRKQLGVSCVTATPVRKHRL